MKKMIKAIEIILCALTMTLILVGCKPGEAAPEKFDIGNISAVNITTGANDVIIRHAEDNVAAVSLKGHKGELAVLEGDTLTIDVPMPDAGINLKSSEPLYINIPKNSYQSITVKSEYGNITTVGLTGIIDAKSELGEIECDLPNSGITAGENGISASLNGFIGESEDTEHTLILYTNIGKITLTR